MKIKLLFFAILSAFAGICSAANPQVMLHITGAVTGDIVLEIYADKAPITAENFLNYVRTGFYDNLIFHRVISGFMIQGGGYDADLVAMTTGPAIINESTNSLSNLRGTIAMARTPEPHSATSEFFINHVDNTFLDFGAIAYGGNTAYYRVGYCVFGKVLSGMDVVDTIAEVETETVGEMEGVPVSDVFIHAEITFDPGECALFEQGDVNGDCVVDLLDFLILAEHWLYGTIAADIDVNGKVNYDDYSVLAMHWMEEDCTAPNWCGGADVNKNGSVEVADVMMLAQRWMQRT